MPSAKTQRYIGWIGVIGVLASLFGCGLIAANQIGAGQAFLILAWLILVPLFGFLLSAYRRSGRVTRRREKRQEQELEALAAAGEAIETPDKRQVDGRQ